MAFTTQSLFELSIQLHRDLRERLRRDREIIDQKIAEVDKVIEREEAEFRKASRHTNGRVDRRPKGENAKIVAALFADPATALSMKEIADQTEMSFSSVQRVLKDGYVQMEDGKWTRRTIGPAAVPGGRTQGDGE